MLTSLPSRALVFFGILARATIILVMMAMAASAASFCPTAQAPCHMMDNGDGQDMGRSVCLLACGVLLETGSDRHDIPSHTLPITHDVLVIAIGGLNIEPDVPPPRVSV